MWLKNYHDTSLTEVAPAVPFCWCAVPATRLAHILNLQTMQVQHVTASLTAVAFGGGAEQEQQAVCLKEIAQGEGLTKGDCNCREGLR